MAYYLDQCLTHGIINQKPERILINKFGLPYHFQEGHILYLHFNQQHIEFLEGYVICLI